MNILRGRAKEDFEKWAIGDNQLPIQNHFGTMHLNIRGMLTEFIDLPFEMQSGVLTRFFDENGIYIDRRIFEGNFEIWDYRNSEPEDPTIIDVDYGESQEENLKKAFKAANEHYNNQ